MPRPPPKRLTKLDRIKTPWDFFKSVFKDYKPDNEVLLDACFEFDWECSKIPKIIKSPDELKMLKKFMRSKYKHLRELYKYYAAVAPAGLIFSIG